MNVYFTYSFIDDKYWQVWEEFDGVRYKCIAECENDSTLIGQTLGLEFLKLNSENANWGWEMFDNRHAFLAEKFVDLL